MRRGGARRRLRVGRQPLEESVADAAGQQTQVASLIDAAFVLITLLFLAELFAHLPSATLGAVVIDAMLGLITLARGPPLPQGQPRRLGVLARRGRRDPVPRHHAGDPHRRRPLAAAADRALLPHVDPRAAASSPVSGVFHDSRPARALETVPDVLVARVDGPLFFADADRFRSRCTSSRRPAGDRRSSSTPGGLPHRHRRGGHPRSRSRRSSRPRGIALAFVAVHPPVLDAVDARRGAGRAGRATCVHPTLADAVEALSAPGAGPAPRVTPLG